MAGSLVHNCPGCGAESIALKIVHSAPVVTNGQNTPYEGHAWWVCPRSSCQMAGGMRLRGKAHDFDWKYCTNNDFTGKYEIKEFWPKPAKSIIPKHLPPPVLRAFKQGEDNYRRPDNLEASGIMFGRSLELAIKEIDEDGKGSLAKRIKEAAKKGLVTQSIADWSDEIRFLRNDAVHEVDGIKKEELEALRGITEMVLRYVFTLPGMVEDLRGINEAVSED